MTEATPPKTGRTYADAFVEIFSTWKLIFLVFGSLIVTFLVVHISAEPGTSVEFLGFVKYQKAKPASLPPTTQTTVDEAAHYYLPTDARLNLVGDVAVPILDGTLAIKPGQFVLRLVGDNISNVRVGLRKLDGTPTDSLGRDGEKTVTFSTDAYLEILYHGKYFAVEVREVEPYKTATVTARSIARATLKLRAISDLRQIGGDE